MPRAQARDAAREILRIVPLVMRAVAAELRAAGELPAPAHFGLLSVLSAQPRNLSELAAVQGVSLPTMSNSITAMVERGWVRRLSRSGDRRVLGIGVTPCGRLLLVFPGSHADRDGRDDQDTRPRSARVGLGQDPTETARQHQRRYAGPRRRSCRERRRPSGQGSVPAPNRSQVAAYARPGW